MLYSAVNHPPVSLLAFIQRGISSSTVTAHTTRVFPMLIKTDPNAAGAKPVSMEILRNWFGFRPSARLEDELFMPNC
jgi:hypothetical protein